MIIKQYTQEHLTDVIDAVRIFKKEDKDKWYEGRWTDVLHYKNVYLKNSKFRTFLALNENNELAGFIIGREINQRKYDIEIHYVKPEVRHNGVAKKLKQSLADFAKNNGYKSIRSYVAFDNKGSIRLNESLGWDKKEVKDCYKFKLKFV
ncbi:GNAT family N-acetyltransferase [Candidatus Woesearchaeota archaeon]|nr:GNAT family N-acetyltransferase [Candidatus Woesearchaeota archaeon]